jgi:hypothetical protein
VREWTPTLPSELPLWELEFWWTLEFLEGDCKGQNSLNWKVPYIIGKLLEHRCLKWVRMTHLGYLKNKLWSKKGSKVKLPLWLGNLLDLLACRRHATYHSKDLNEGYNISLDLTSIRGLHKKLWAFKVVEVLISEILRFQLVSLGTKWHLGIGPMARHKEYYNTTFPQVCVMVSFVSLCLPVICLCTKNVPTTH